MTGAGGGGHPPPSALVSFAAEPAEPGVGVGTPPSAAGGALAEPDSAQP